MKQGVRGYIGIGLMIAVFVIGTLAGFFGGILEQEGGEFFGANVTTTTLQNTINTFRTNVNDSLININDQLTSSTAINPGHQHTSTSIQQWLRGASSSITNASGTNQTLSGFLQVTGSSTFQDIKINGTVATLPFGNASGTNITVTGFLQGANLNISGRSVLDNVSSTDLTASGFLQGVNLSVSTRALITNVSSTNITASGYLQISGNVLVDSAGTKYVTSSLTVLDVENATTTGGTWNTTNSAYASSSASASSTFTLSESRRILITWTGFVQSTVGGDICAVSFYEDGESKYGDIGKQTIDANDAIESVSWTYVTNLLSAAQHTFWVNGRRVGGTGTCTFHQQNASFLQL